MDDPELPLKHGYSLDHLNIRVAILAPYLEARLMSHLGPAFLPEPWFHADVFCF